MIPEDPNESGRPNADNGGQPVSEVSPNIDWSSQSAQELAEKFLASEDLFQLANLHRGKRIDKQDVQDFIWERGDWAEPEAHRRAQEFNLKPSTLAKFGRDPFKLEGSGEVRRVTLKEVDDVIVQSGKIWERPLARQLAEALGLDASELEGTGEARRITLGDVQRVIEERTRAMHEAWREIEETIRVTQEAQRVIEARIWASDDAHELADEFGLRPSQIDGSGEDERITLEDVLRVSWQKGLLWNNPKAWNLAEAHNLIWASDDAHELADEFGLRPSQIDGSGEDERITLEDVQRVILQRGLLWHEDAARDLAEALGLHPSELAGSGPQGRIRLVDVQRVVAQRGLNLANRAVRGLEELRPQAFTLGPEQERIVDRHDKLIKALDGPFGAEDLVRNFAPDEVPHFTDHVPVPEGAVQVPSDQLEPFPIDPSPQRVLRQRRNVG